MKIVTSTYPGYVYPRMSMVFLLLEVQLRSSINNKNTIQSGWDITCLSPTKTDQGLYIKYANLGFWTGRYIIASYQPVDN